MIEDLLSSAALAIGILLIWFGIGALIHKPKDKNPY